MDTITIFKKPQQTAFFSIFLPIAYYTFILHKSEIEAFAVEQKLTLTLTVYRVTNVNLLN